MEIGQFLLRSISKESQLYHERSSKNYQIRVYQVYFHHTQFVYLLIQKLLRLLPSRTFSHWFWAKFIRKGKWLINFKYSTKESPIRKNKANNLWQKILIWIISDWISIPYMVFCDDLEVKWEDSCEWHKNQQYFGASQYYQNDFTCYVTILLDDIA